MVPNQQVMVQRQVQCEECQSRPSALVSLRNSVKEESMCYVYLLIPLIPRSPLAKRVVLLLTKRQKTKKEQNDINYNYLRRRTEIQELGPK